MENYQVSLKNLYRLITVNDYPIYSCGVISRNNKKGMTLVRFWKQYFLYDWQNTAHGRQIWRTSGSQNRYLSELCNRRCNVLFHESYVKEILETLNEELLWRQMELFMIFFEEKQFVYAVFLKKLREFLQKARQSDPALSDDAFAWLEAQTEHAAKNEARLPEACLAGWLMSIFCLHAIAGDCMRNADMTKLLEHRCRKPEILWKRRQESAGQEAPVFLTTQNSAVCQKGVSRDHFFGRERELYDLKELLHKGGKYMVSGIGGVGKTELLRHLLAWCVDAREAWQIGVIQYEGSLADSFSRCFRKLTGGGSEERFRECLFRLAEQPEKKTVLFIDNVNAAPEQDSGLSELAKLPCTVIVSSRQCGLEGFQTYLLQTPDTQTSELIFRDNYGRILSDGERQELGTLLEHERYHHPLTLRLLGRGAGVRKWSIGTLKQALLDSRLLAGQTYASEEDSLQRTYCMLYEMSDLSETQQRLVRVFAILPYTVIEPCFARTFLCGFGASGDALEQELCQLARLGWLSECEAGWQMHPVIAESIRTQRPAEAEFEPFWVRARKCCEELYAPFQIQDDRLTELMERFFYAAVMVCGNVSAAHVLMAINAVRYTHEEARESYVRKLRELASRCGEKTPEIRIAIYTLEFDLFDNADEGMLNEAQTVYAQTAEQVPAWWRQEFLLNLSKVLALTGQYEQSEWALREVLRLGGGAEWKMRVQVWRGHTCLRQNKIEAGLFCLERAEWLARMNAWEHPERAHIYLNTGNFSLSYGWTAQGKQCIDWLKSRYGSGTECSSLEIRTWLNQLEMMLAIQNEDMKAALAAAQDFKEAATICYSRGSHNVLIATNDLGTVYQKMGRYAEALEQFQEALQMLQRYPNARDLQFNTWNAIGVTYREMGEYGKARTALLKAHDLAEGKKRAIAARNLAFLCRRTGETDQEYEWLAQALPVYESMYAADDPFRRQVRTRMDELKRLGYWEPGEKDWQK